MNQKEFDPNKSLTEKLEKEADAVIQSIEDEKQHAETSGQAENSDGSDGHPGDANDDTGHDDNRNGLDDGDACRNGRPYSQKREYLHHGHQ